MNTLAQAVVALVLTSFLPAATIPAAAPSCVGLDRPLAGEVVSSYQPVGRFEGHWGVDVRGSGVVRAAASGIVTFSGVVAGNRTVTVDHGGGLKTSYSYLDGIWRGRGAFVGRGDAVGTAGLLHGEGPEGVHFSVRIDGIYRDPAGMFGCRSFELPAALRLVTVPPGLE